MRRFWRLAAVGLLLLMMTGCSLLPSTSSGVSTSAPATPGVATRIAAAVLATVQARIAPATTEVTATRAPVATATNRTATSSSASHPSPTASPTPVPTPMLLAPVHLQQRENGGGKLAPRYWTNTGAVVLTVGSPNGTSPGLRPQVELEPLRTPYNGIPSGEGQALLPGETTAITVAINGLAEGAYHWRARLVTGPWRGPWADYYPGPAFRLDRTPPSTVVISPTTYPDQGRAYNLVQGHFTWTAATDNGAIQGYQSSIDRHADGVPSGPPSAARSADFGPLADGTLYVHVRAEDWAGNFGPVATFSVRIDHLAPALSHVRFDRFQFNPAFDVLGMRFTPSKNVSVRVLIKRQQTGGTVRQLDLGPAVAGKPFTVNWDGRNYRGILARPGLYTMLVSLTDQLGNQGSGLYTGLGVNYRRIVVHLASQSMQVYDGDSLLQTSLVTTGNALLPTPIGVWHIGAKFHPYKFISPWKKGSPYYYAPSNVGYALYFHAGGYFLHDAPWRTVYGPGTNTAPGPPGIYSGTHGCVNVPGTLAAWLYHWAPIGTIVVVEQ